MTIRIDNRPMYLQVIDKIRLDIENGVYKEKEKLPSEFILAKQLGVSRATLREALRFLEEESVIIRRHGVGTFINTKPLFNSGIEQISSITDMIVQAGMSPGTIFLSRNVQSPSDSDVKGFNCLENEDVTVIERVRTANGEPVVYCIDKILSRNLPSNYSHEESIFDLLEKIGGRKITYAITHIEPIGYHDTISPTLNCDPETALLLLKQMHYDENDEPILFSLNYFKADKFSFHVVRKRLL